MSITSAIVLFAVIWFMVLFVVLPIGLRTQGDEGKIVPGTHAGSPASTDMWRTARWVTLITIMLWILLYVVITSGWISVENLDWFDRLDREPAADGTGG
ncbi:DUF1467 family protein [Palleronia sp. LCG004]|uniref:DUF1467 family protein n=1 Tax=Palleronia sp. LCG004 TaxID=3079304 RepID=UPI00294325F0|nr:DUF1467 family protein [Palleronia sp. LCG004]WOI57424.1 DUF1467 family protein [Palleronia sp. LCG004]